MLLFLYADDTVIVADTPDRPQHALDAMHEYCVINELKVNATKTKIVVCSSGKLRNVPRFTYNNEAIEVTYDFQYLGLKLNFNNKFKVAQKDLFDRASRAMFSLLRKCRKLMLPIEIQIELFDKMIVPILLYGAEIWCPDMCDLATKLQLKFYKMILGLSKTTPSIMVFGELGQYPLEITAKCRMLCYWHKLTNVHNKDKLSSVIYRFLHNLYRTNVYKSPFLLHVHSTLDTLGYSGLWLNQNLFEMTSECFKNMVKTRLKDQYVQSFFSEINDNELYYNYRLFKDNFLFERYLTDLPEKYAKTFMKFRTLNHKLPIQKGRAEGIPRPERICTKCALNDLGDEFHYILVCPYFHLERKKYLKKYYLSKPNVIKFQDLLASSKKSQLANVVKFITHLIKSM